MKKKLFSFYPNLILSTLAFICLALASLYTFIVLFRLPQPEIAALNIPLVYLPKPTTGFTGVGQELKTEIDESTPFLAITSKQSFFCKIRCYKDGLEQNSLRIKYDQLQPIQLASEAAKLRDGLFAKSNPLARTLIILPAPDLNMAKLQEVILHMRKNNYFENIVLADGTI